MRREFKKKSKVLLIDDNYEHLVGIRELLNLEGTFDVVGIATNVTIGLNLIKKYQPDIVLLDMNMPEKDGLQGITTRVIRIILCSTIRIDRYII